MNQTLTPEDLAKIFKARGVEPDCTYIDPQGSAHWGVRAWALPDGYLIEYGDSKQTGYKVWHSIENIAFWFCRPEPMPQHIADALAAADKILNHPLRN